MQEPPASHAAVSVYVCPACRRPLRLRESVLACESCRVGYPIVSGIPDFILEDPARSDVPLLRWASSHYDRIAPLYERMRYPWRQLLHGGLAAPSLGDLVRMASEIARKDGALVLDVACGPGTLGRRIASPVRTVYGIDISMGMLRRGRHLVRSGGIPNIHFARAQVERVPFGDRCFDAAMCTAALHLFADPALALCEIGRVLKPGARLVVQTMSAERRGIFRFQRIRAAAHRRGAHLFTLAQLAEYLERAGFENFQPQVFGSIILFRAQKARDDRH